MAGGKLDRAPQLVALHRTDEDLVAGEEPRQLGICRAAAIEVGANGEHDSGTAVTVLMQSHERAGEGGALGRVVTEREGLLELVHGHERVALPAGTRGRLLERPNG